MEPFRLHDAHPLRVPAGRSVVNLRELLAAVRDVDDQVLRHHLFRFSLDPAYDFSHFGHEFAYWAEFALQDAALAERLGNFDPYLDPEPRALRAALADIIDEHLAESPTVPWARPGCELHLARSILVVYPTGREAHTLKELGEMIRGSSRGSLHLHFFEARSRIAARADDFSTWIEDALGRSDVAQRIRRIDFPALRVDALRSAIVDALGGAEA